MNLDLIHETKQGRSLLNAFSAALGDCLRGHAIHQWSRYLFLLIFSPFQYVVNYSPEATSHAH